MYYYYGDKQQSEEYFNHSLKTKIDLNLYSDFLASQQHQ